MKKIISVVGARPNFMKVAPLHRQLAQHPGQFEHMICHTGQHYDEMMSKVFFDDLELPRPDFSLGVGSGSHTEQTARIMIEFEKIVLSEKPDAVIVVGDVNSTVACTLVAVKSGIPVAHVEAGLRSFDRTMPEEINRVMTDAVADYLFVTERSGVDNLKNEGVPERKIFFVGNTMIDSLLRYKEKSDRSAVLSRLKIHPQHYALVTLHRPRNVDSPDELRKIVLMLNAVGEKMKVVFPVHPRTKNNLTAAALLQQFSSNVLLTEPAGYIDFLALLKNASVVVTDSGGVQEETTFLGIQCITARENTERPSTLLTGTNRLAGTNWDTVRDAAFDVLSGNIKNGTIPELWDGRASERIVSILQSTI
ncbi:MAG: UDP-N-acetylglucosamine 2-epimerase (non-hydrolyzing) [Bacteroidota bacterium]